MRVMLTFGRRGWRINAPLQFRAARMKAWRERVRLPMNPAHHRIRYDRRPWREAQAQRWIA
jgi:hypothetical protein